MLLQGAIFLMATYGDGEPTDSASDFWSWLTKAAEEADNGIGDDSMLKVGQMVQCFDFRQIVL